MLRGTVCKRCLSGSNLRAEQGKKAENKVYAHMQMAKKRKPPVLDCRN